MKNICFTGHRQIRNDSNITVCLEETLRNLIEQHGATDFYSGGAIGWDTLCAETILKLRNRYPRIRLHLVLPCCEAEQTSSWNSFQKETYQKILSAADNVEFVSEHYYDGCMKKRNARLIEYADCCVCYYNEKRSASGTGQTVRMALKRNIDIVNLFSSSSFPIHTK